MTFSQLISRSGNQAVALNPPTGLDLHITEHGSDWLWSVFSVLALYSIALLVVGRLSKPDNERFFYYNHVASSFFMAITYYTMASDLGWTGIQAEFNHDTSGDSGVEPGIRQIFYARYVGWFLSFLPYLANLSVISAVPISTALFSALGIEIFVVGLLIGSLIHSTYKWGYFVFSAVSLGLVLYEFLFTFRRSANDESIDAGRAVTITASVLSFLLFIYPVSWGLSEGGNVIQNDSEQVFYGVLDLCVFVFLPSYFLFAVRDVDFATLGIAPPRGPLFHSEKDARYSGDTMISNAPAAPAPAAAAPAPAADPATVV